MFGSEVKAVMSKIINGTAARTSFQVLNVRQKYAELSTLNECFFWFPWHLKSCFEIILAPYDWMGVEMVHIWELSTKTYVQVLLIV